MIKIWQFYMPNKINPFPEDYQDNFRLFCLSSLFPIQKLSMSNQLKHSYLEVQQFWHKSLFQLVEKVLLVSIMILEINNLKLRLFKVKKKLFVWNCFWGAQYHYQNQFPRNPDVSRFLLPLSLSKDLESKYLTSKLTIVPSHDRGLDYVLLIVLQAFPLMKHIRH